jgi:hypothetical protein
MPAAASPPPGQEDTVWVECPFCHYRFFAALARLTIGSELHCPACKKHLTYKVSDLLTALGPGLTPLRHLVEPFKLLRCKP